MFYLLSLFFYLFYFSGHTFSPRYPRGRSARSYTSPVDSTYEEKGPGDAGLCRHSNSRAGEVSRRIPERFGGKPAHTGRDEEKQGEISGFRHSRWS
jgi:hypothetical protein